MLSIHYGIGLTYFNLLLVVLISISFNYSNGVYNLLINNGYMASSAISKSSYVYLFSLPAKLKYILKNPVFLKSLFLKIASKLSDTFPLHLIWPFSSFLVLIYTSVKINSTKW